MTCFCSHLSPLSFKPRRPCIMTTCHQLKGLLGTRAPWALWRACSRGHYEGRCGLPWDQLPQMPLLWEMHSKFQRSDLKSFWKGSIYKSLLLLLGKICYTHIGTHAHPRYNSSLCHLTYIMSWVSVLVCKPPAPPPWTERSWPEAQTAGLANLLLRSPPLLCFPGWQGLTRNGLQISTQHASQPCRQLQSLGLGLLLKACLHPATPFLPCCSKHWSPTKCPISSFLLDHEWSKQGSDHVYFYYPVPTGAVTTKKSHAYSQPLLYMLMSYLPLHSLPQVSWPSPECGHDCLSPNPVGGENKGLELRHTIHDSNFISLVIWFPLSLQQIRERQGKDAIRHGNQEKWVRQRPWHQEESWASGASRLYYISVIT